MEYSIYLDSPLDFNPTVEVSSCHCEYGDRFLLLRRHPKKSQGDTWGLPGGKHETGENPRAAVIREIHEEVGLHIDDDGLEFVGKLYVRLPHVDYVFHMFRKCYLVLPSIKLGLEEHLESKWVTMHEAMRLPLITGGAEALLYYKKILSEKSV